ncbi:ankryin [Chitinophaga sp. SYP-B3965]|uniref:ankyrin repeat domain-containing protein n=1 Tax=Chitinophaga sp. SYP-B3965 TaxID=2663120 RepID=UPI001299E598|nr:ankyrin repeat domain-containing protein [Chitinophaga sp. SYP-B3965]MRG47329.1 ankryin [Chitinophaga sp. SYP-B3965]
MTRTAFIKAATWHGSLDEADQLLATHPELATSDIHTAAITGNVEAVNRFLKEDPANATAISAPYGGTALIYLCMSKYLRLDRSRSNDFLQAATALLHAGADANAGFWTEGKYPEFETALYGAAGIAHHAPLTKLLLEHGADPNDNESVYHSTETHENDAMKLLVETGKLTEDNLTLMLIRKHDWHDYEGVKYLLEKGVDPNKTWSGRGWYPLHHALARSNSLAIIKLLLDHKADPHIVSDGLTAIARAAREGRSDVLALLEEKPEEGIDQLIAACAMGDKEAAQHIIEQKPKQFTTLMNMSSQLLPRFCLSNNKPGVQLLLDLGIDVNTPYDTGDGYFGIPEGSLPIHVAAWLGWPAIVQLLIERGAYIETPDKNGHTPLALAIGACVHSYWTDRRNTISIEALLDAGASPVNIPLPSGYPEADDLLRAALQK